MRVNIQYRFLINRLRNFNLEDLKPVVKNAPKPHPPPGLPNNIFDFFLRIRFGQPLQLFHISVVENLRDH